MPGFDKVEAYQTVDSTDREDETNLQCQNQLDDTNNVKGKILYIILHLLICAIVSNGDHKVNLKFYLVSYIEQLYRDFINFMIQTHILRQI